MSCMKIGFLATKLSSTWHRGSWKKRLVYSGECVYDFLQHFLFITCFSLFSLYVIYKGIFTMENCKKKHCILAISFRLGKQKKNSLELHFMVICTECALFALTQLVTLLILAGYIFNKYLEIF